MNNDYKELDAAIDEFGASIVKAYDLACLKFFIFGVSCLALSALLG